MSDYMRIAGAMLLPTVGGFASSIAQTKDSMTWYRGLNKPWWTPPDKVFPVAWMSLYAAMGYGSYLVWRDGGGFSGDALLPLSTYGASLALNFAWTPIFFKYHKMGLSVAVIFAYTGLTGVNIFLFHRVNCTSAMLLAPLLGWLGLASSVNCFTWLNNKEETKSE